MGKKNKKGGGKASTVDLSTFLSAGGGPPAPEPTAGGFVLPSAPRSSMGVDIDESKLPKRPPYTAFLGNLPYEITDDDIIEFFQNRKIKVLSVRIPRQQDGTDRIKGFGYAEFETVEGLKEAVRASGDQLLNRSVRIDLAGTREDDHGGPGGYQTQRSDEDSDWRSNRPGPVAPGGRGNGDRGDRYGDRGDRYGDRGDRYGDRGDRFGDRGDRPGPPPSRADEDTHWVRGQAPPPGPPRGQGGFDGPRGPRSGGFRDGGGDFERRDFERRDYERRDFESRDFERRDFERRGPPPSRADEEEQWSRGQAPPPGPPPEATNRHDSRPPPRQYGRGANPGNGGFDRRGPPSRADEEEQWARGVAPPARGPARDPQSRPKITIKTRGRPDDAESAERSNAPRDELSWRSEQRPAPKREAAGSSRQPAAKEAPSNAPRSPEESIGGAFAGLAIEDSEGEE